MKKADFINAIQIVSILFCIGVMVYGIYKYPSAPIRFAENKYIDKARREYSEEEYKNFKTWERTLVGSFIITFGGNLMMEFFKKRKKRMP